MSKLLQSIGLKEKKPTIATTVSDLASKNLKSGYFSKRGPTRSSKYNLRYWVLTDSYLYYFTSATSSDHALGMIDLKSCKLNIENCGPCEFVILCATSEKSREYFCKTDTAENRTSWGGVIQSVINKLIAGRQTFHGTPSFSPIQPRTSAPEASSSTSPRGVSVPGTSPMAGAASTAPEASSSTGFASPSGTGTAPLGQDTFQRPSLDSASSSSPALNRQSMMFGAAGPVARFNPLGASEIVRVFLPDNSSKTVLFDTTQSVGALAQQVAKKLGPGFDLYCLYACSSGDTQLLSAESRLVDVVTNWPSKNDPENYRLIFQPKEEADRQRASTIGFLNVQTTANAHSNVPKASSFVSQVMGAIRKKPEWTGNMVMSSIPTPHLHRGLLTKAKASAVGKEKDLIAIVTETALYYFDAAAAGQNDKSKGWMPLEKSGLFKERGPVSFVLHFTFPGTLDLHKQFDVSCKTEEEKAAWMAVLVPRCKGVVPVKKQAPPRRNASASSVPSPRKAPPQADVAAMLVATPSEGPKLTHPTAGRPKGAGKRPPSGRPKGAEIASPAGAVNPFGANSMFAASASSPAIAVSPRPTSTSEFSSAPSSGASNSTASTSTPYGTPTTTVPTTATSTPMTIPPSVPALTNIPNGTPLSDPSPRLYDGTPMTPNSFNGSPHITSSSPHLPYTGSSFGSQGASDTSMSPPLSLQQQPVGSFSPRGPNHMGSTSSPRFTPGSPTPGLYPGNVMSTSPGLLPTTAAVGFGPAPGTPPISNSLLSQALASQPPPAVVSPRGLSTSNPMILPVSPRGLNSSANGLHGSNGSLSSSNGSLSGTPSGSSSSFLPTGVAPPSAMPSGPPPSTSTAPSNTAATPSVVSVAPTYLRGPTGSSGVAALTGPNPNLIPASPPPQGIRPGGSAGYSYSTTATSLGNPALNPALSPYQTSSAPFTGAESDVIDMRAVLGISSPAIPKQPTFPTYQSPHITTPPPTTMNTSGTIYSPVLAKPMPLPQSNPSAAQPKHNSSPFLTSTTTTVSIQPLRLNSNTSSGARSDTPGPEIIMDILAAPMDSSPFDDLPFD